MPHHNPLGKISKYLFAIGLVLALLPFTKYFQSWKEKSKEHGERLAQTPFFIAHVLDPNVDDLRYTSWSHTDWMAWLNRREKAHRNANKNPERKPLPDKGMNTVVIASHSQLMNAFQNRGDHNRFHSSSEYENQRNTFWADTRFASFVFLRVNKNQFRVYNCPPMYMAVRFEKGVPVHLHKQCMDQTTGCNVKFSKDCILVE